MKPAGLLVVLSFLATPGIATAGLFGEDTPSPVAVSGSSYDVAFSPGVSDAVVKAMTSAKKSVRIVSHKFVSKEVAEAFVKMNREGKDVKIILDDKSNADGYSSATFLQNMGLNPRVTKDGSGVYACYAIIDDSDVIIGNISDLGAAEEKTNAATVIVIHNTPELAKRYLANWQMLWDAAVDMKKSN